MGDDNGLINIDFQPVASVANNVIDKFSQAVGWLATPRGSRKDSEAAVDIYIKDIQEDDTLPAIVKAAKISSARKDIKEYLNMQDILQHAKDFSLIYDSNNNETLDEDWTMYFYDKGKNISSGDAKVLWGKILAEECNAIGTIPKSLIHILSVMSRQDAELFDVLCGFVPDRVLGNDAFIISDPLIFDTGHSQMVFKNGLTYDRFQDLEALGLLHLNVVDVRNVLDGDLTNSKVGFLYFDSLIEVSKLREEFPVGNVVFTNNGKILASLIERKRLDEFEEYVKEYYEEKGYEIRIRKVR